MRIIHSNSIYTSFALNAMQPYRHTHVLITTFWLQLFTMAAFPPDRQIYDQQPVCHLRHPSRSGRGPGGSAVCSDPAGWPCYRTFQDCLVRGRAHLGHLPCHHALQPTRGRWLDTLLPMRPSGGGSAGRHDHHRLARRPRHDAAAHVTVPQ